MKAGRAFALFMLVMALWRMGISPVHTLLAIAILVGLVSFFWFAVVKGS